MPVTPSFLGVCGGIGRKIMRPAWVTQEIATETKGGKRREGEKSRG